MRRDRRMTGLVKLRSSARRWREQQVWAGHVMESAQRLQFCSGTSMGTFSGQDAHDD